MPEALQAFLGGGDADDEVDYRGIEACRHPSGGGGPDPETFFNEITLEPLSRNAIDLEWDGRGLETEDGPAILRLVTRFNVNIDRRLWLRALTRRAEARADYAHLIQPQPCGGLTGPRCVSDGQTVFAGYRDLISSFGPDAVFPRQGLDFSVIATETINANARVVTGPRCALVAPFILGPLAAAGLNFPFAAEAFCTFLDDALEDGIQSGLCDTAGSLQQLVSLMVNPPVLRLTLREAALASGADLNEEEDMDGNEVEGTGDGAVSDEELALFLNPILETIPTTIPLETLVGAFVEVADEVILGLSPTATYVDDSGTEQVVKLTTIDGAFTDEGIVAVASGAQIDVDFAGVDLSNVLPLCTRENDLTLCIACQLDLAPDGVCVDGLPSTVPFPQSLLNAVGQAPLSFAIDPSPRIAALLSGAPLAGEVLRQYFARPLPADARYVSSVAVGTADEPGARLGYIVDPDNDGVDSSEDNCPLTPNPPPGGGPQPNVDGDYFGYACDPCPGVFNEANASFGELWLSRDFDDDGLPNGCDCDVDGDTCPNPGESYVGGVVGEGDVFTCAPGPGQTFEGLSTARNDGMDFDEDGTPDSCDADLDEDGVPNGADNCPLGDGDTEYEIGIDDDPSQTDSGGSRLGDLCDPVCGPNGPPICFVSPGEPGAGGGGAPPGAGGAPYLPGIPASVCRGGACFALPLLPCFGVEVDRCNDFASDVLRYDALGRVRDTVFAQNLGLTSGIERVLATNFDLDGDGIGEQIIASPSAAVMSSCSGTDNDCAPLPMVGAGAVLVVASLDGSVLRRFDGVEDGADFGRSIELAGDVLAIGSPGANGGAGSVELIRLSTGQRTTVPGRRTDALGSDLLLLEDSWPPVFLASSPGARRRAPKLRAINVFGEVVARFGRRYPSFETFAVTRDANGGVSIVAGAPGAKRGRGLVVWFDEDGSERCRVRGRRGDRLGSALVARGTQVFAGAPGANQGNGLVRAYDAFGDETAAYAYFGTAVGSRLALTRDTDGDGEDELWVSMNLEGSGVSVPWPVGAL